MSVREEIIKLETSLKDLVFKSFTENEEVTEEFIKEVFDAIKQQILKDESGIYKIIFTNEKDIDNFINEIIEETKKELVMLRLRKDTKLPLDKIVVGQFLKWSCTKDFVFHDCPCVITSVDLQQKIFSVKTFDDFQEIDLLSLSRITRDSEFTIMPKTHVINYLNSKYHSKNKEKENLEKLLIQTITDMASINMELEKLKKDEI